MIKIKKPFIEKNGEKVRCICEIIVNNSKKNVWFEINKKYEEYLTIDRADAYVIGLLNYAMRNNHNIQCDVPITDELLHNLKEILIPSLTKNSEDLYSIKIIAKSIAPIEEGEHVGTGCSCGIDSFYSIKKHNSDEYPSIKLTDLCINNVGAFNECYAAYGEEKTKKERYEVTREVAKKMKLNLIETDSNFYSEIPQDHSLTHTYSSCFAIYMLQKYWKTYYYASSGYDFSHFSLKDNSKHDSSYYELLSLQCFSISSLRIYSDGGELKRFEKTKYIVDDKLAQEYLHVCIRKSTNCGECTKCNRTLLALDALNSLDKFNKVFDIEKYNKNKQSYYNWLWEQHKMNDEMNEPTYQMLKNRDDFQISKSYKRKYNNKENIKKVKKIIPKKLQKSIKKLIGRN